MATLRPHRSTSIYFIVNLSSIPLLLSSSQPNKTADYTMFSACVLVLFLLRAISSESTTEHGNATSQGTSFRVRILLGFDITYGDLTPGDSQSELSEQSALSSSTHLRFGVSIGILLTAFTVYIGYRYSQQLRLLLIACLSGILLRLLRQGMRPLDVEHRVNFPVHNEIPGNNLDVECGGIQLGSECEISSTHSDRLSVHSEVSIYHDTFETLLVDRVSDTKE